MDKQSNIHMSENFSGSNPVNDPSQYGQQLDAEQQELVKRQLQPGITETFNMNDLQPIARNDSGDALLARVEVGINGMQWELWAQYDARKDTLNTNYVALFDANPAKPRAQTITSSPDVKGDTMVGRTVEGEGLLADPSVSRKHVAIGLHTNKESGLTTLTFTDHSSYGTALIMRPLAETAAPAPASQEQPVASAEPTASQQRIQERLGAVNETPQRPAREIYTELADTANRLSSGTFDPIVMNRKMKQLLNTMPESERAALGDITALVYGMVDEHGRQTDRYGSTAQARQIMALAQKRLREL